MMTPDDIREAAQAARQVIEARADRILADADLANALVTSAAHVLESGAVAVAAALLAEAGKVSEPYRLIALEFAREADE